MSSRSATSKGSFGSRATNSCGASHTMPLGTVQHQGPLNSDCSRGEGLGLMMNFRQIGRPAACTWPTCQLLSGLLMGVTTGNRSLSMRKSSSRGSTIIHCGRHVTAQAALSCSPRCARREATAPVKRCPHSPHPQGKHRLPLSALQPLAISTSSTAHPPGREQSLWERLGLDAVGCLMPSDCPHVL